MKKQRNGHGLEEVALFNRYWPFKSSRLAKVPLTYHGRALKINASVLTGDEDLEQK